MTFKMSPIVIISYLWFAITINRLKNQRVIPHRPKK